MGTPPGPTNLSSATFAHLISLLHDAVVITDAGASILFANDAATTLFGWGPGELVGQPVEALVPTHAREGHRAHVRSFTAAGPAVRHLAGRPVMGVTRDGVAIPVDVRLAALPGDPPMFAAVVTDRRDLEREREGRRASEARYRELFEQALEGIIEVGRDGAVVEANPAARDLFGAATFAGATRPGGVRSLFCDPAAYPAVARQLMRGEKLRRFECRLRCDAGWFWASVTAQVVGPEGAARCRIVDVTDRIRAQQALAADEARLRSLIDHIPDAITVFDADGRVRYANATAHQQYGGGPPRGRWHGVAAEDRARVAGEFAAVAAEAGASRRVLCSVADATGQPTMVQATIVNLLDEPAVRGVMVHARDVTTQHRFQAELSHLALHDPLTGLANRAALHQHLDSALARMARTGGALAVLFCDLDNFKYVNDSLGHAAGDAVLRTTAQRLRTTTRAGDMICRFGGDEFVVLCPLDAPASRAADLRAIAQRILAAVCRPVELDGYRTTPTVSLGIAVATDASVTAEALLSEADAALFLAKERGRNQYAFFDADLRAHATDRLHKEQGLRAAVERDELKLHYQPIVALATGRAVGCEALVRWRHPELGLLGPGEFIGIAEESGLIVAVGRWVLAEAANRLAAWAAGGGERAAWYVAVNVSARQLTRARFVEEVTDTLARAGADPARLVLELTEGTLITASDAIAATLAELRSRGVRIAIDDFGTGYSSLAYLHSLACDVVKIDRAFIRQLDDEGRGGGLVEAIIAMAGALRLDVVAEGVETTSQAEALRRAGCGYAQGWLFGRPAPEPGIPPAANALHE